MRSFQLFLVKSDRYKILISDYNSLTKANSLSSTFDENINFTENDQITLSFNMMKYIDLIRNKANNDIDHRIENKHYKLLCMGAQLELILDNKESYIFIIDKIKPVVGNDNVKFEYTCQDQVSYQWSRRNLGMSYSTIEEGGVENIYTIATKVLQKSNIFNWKVKIDEDNEVAQELLSDKKMTFEITDSNPYNIIIEACNTLNAYMRVNYTHKYITFYQKDKIKFSGYRYRPYSNLKTFDVDYDMSEMATIMHVYGGTNENNEIISLMPAFSNRMQKWWEDHHNEYVKQLIPWDSIQWSDEIGYWKNINFIAPQAIQLNRYGVCKLRVPLTGSGTQCNITYECWQNGWLMGTDIKTAYFISEPRGSFATFDFTDDARDYDIKILSITGGIDPGVNFFAKTFDIWSVNECDWQFITNAQKNPSLGNFLYNFHFFIKNKLMDVDAYKAIKESLDIDMAYNNMWLKCCESQYYQLYSELFSLIQEGKSTLELIQVNYMNGVDASLLENNYTQIINQIYPILKEMYSSQILLKSYDDINTHSYQIFDSGADLLQNLVNEYKAYLDILLESELQIKSMQNIQLTELRQAELQYHLSKYYSLLSVVGSSWEIKTYDVKGFVDDSGAWKEENLSTSYMATYPRLIGDICNLFKKMGESEKSNKLYEKLIEYRQKNDNIWSNLYHNYSQFLYETKYENDSELNSINLYNQAQIYYADYSKPNANYSIQVLELKELESAGAARLAIGSKIKVYDKELGYNESDSLTQETFNNIQHTNNDLIVTSINYVLRDSNNIQIGVEQISSYQSILQKLIRSVN